MIFIKKTQNDIPNRGLKTGSLAKKYENYSGRFPEGIPTKEIQQCRQARSRPVEKETLNIMLREKMSKNYAAAKTIRDHIF